MNWSYYLSYTSSVIKPLDADMSFNDFKKSLTGDSKSKETNENSIGMNKKQINAQVSRAEKVLNGYVPVKKGGAC